MFFFYKFHFYDWFSHCSHASIALFNKFDNIRTISSSFILKSDRSFTFTTNTMPFPLSPDTLSLILHWQLHYLYQWNLCAAWFHDCIASDNDWSRLLCFHWLTLQWVQAGFYTHVLFFLFIIIFWNRPVHSGFIFNPLQQ